jgi:hypothetical protein
MRLNLARPIAALVFGIVAIVAAPAFATNANISGTVNLIKIQDDATGSMFFTVNSTTSVGNCIKNNNNVMALIPDTDRGKAMLSTVEAAMLAGKTVTVHLDDTSSSSNYCWTKYLTVGP